MEPEATDEWMIVEVGAPVTIMEIGQLFDNEPTDAGARDFLAREGHVMLVARADDNTPIGFVTGVEMRHPDKDPEMFVYELGVAEDWRRRGVASALLAALEAHALERGCAGVWTASERDNKAALATYRSRGAAIEQDAVVASWDELAPEAHA